MSVTIFSELKDKYPEIISQMKPTFTSHEFILTLAQAYQVEYVDALCASRNRVHRGKRTPFRYVHNQLANLLKAFPELVRKLEEVDSVDIFGRPNKCAKWEKINPV